MRCPRGVPLLILSRGNLLVQRGASTQPQASAFLELVRTEGSRKVCLG